MYCFIPGLALERPFEIDRRDSLGIPAQALLQLKQKICTGSYRPLNTLCSHENVRAHISNYYNVEMILRLCCCINLWLYWCNCLFVACRWKHSSTVVFESILRVGQRLCSCAIFHAKFFVTWRILVNARSLPIWHGIFRQSNPPPSTLPVLQVTCFHQHMYLGDNLHPMLCMSTDYLLLVPVVYRVSVAEHNRRSMYLLAQGRMNPALRAQLVCPATLRICIPVLNCPGLSRRLLVAKHNEANTRWVARLQAHIRRHSTYSIYIQPWRDRKELAVCNNVYICMHTYIWVSCIQFHLTHLLCTYKCIAHFFCFQNIIVSLFPLSKYLNLSPFIMWM